MTQRPITKLAKDLVEHDRIIATTPERETYVLTVNHVGYKIPLTGTINVTVKELRWPLNIPEDEEMEVY